MDQEKQPIDENADGNNQANTSECRITKLKGRVRTLNIIFGAMMFASAVGTIVLKGGEITELSALNVILIISFVLGILGIIITGIVWKITNAVTHVKSIVSDIKNR